MACQAFSCTSFSCVAAALEANLGPQRYEKCKETSLMWAIGYEDRCSLSFIIKGDTLHARA